jgi:hypothetical protein
MEAGRGGGRRSGNPETPYSRSAPSPKKEVMLICRKKQNTQ